MLKNLQVRPGVRGFRFQLPTPYLIGPVNVYLLVGDAVVLIDTGPYTAEGVEMLKAHLRDAGVGLRDLDALLVTHGHIDHFGMASYLRERSNASVYAHADERVFMESFPGTHLRFSQKAGEYAQSHGFPPGLYKRVEAYHRGTLEAGQPIPVDVPVQNGQTLVFGDIRLRVLHTPGHTSGSVSFHDAGARTLYCGDTLLHGITPVTFFRGTIHWAQMGTRYYLETLRKIRELDVAEARPGHREPFGDVSGTVRRAERHIDLRLRRVLSILRDGPRTAYEIFTRMAPEMRLSEWWLYFADLLGMLEWLEGDHRVQAFEDGGRVMFRLA